MTLEYETKCLLSQNEYFFLINQYPLASSILQKNYYFETENYYFKKQNSALRVRIVDNTYQLTVKKKVKQHHEEYNNLITKTNFQELLNTKTVPTALQHLIPVKKFKYVIHFETKRRKIKFKNHLIELDETKFSNITDYEIEVEAASTSLSQAILHEFLQLNNLKYKKSEPKISRYFKYQS